MHLNSIVSLAHSGHPLSELFIHLDKEVHRQAQGKCFFEIIISDKFTQNDKNILIKVFDDYLIPQHCLELIKGSRRLTPIDLSNLIVDCVDRCFKLSESILLKNETPNEDMTWVALLKFKVMPFTLTRKPCFELQSQYELRPIASLG